MTITLPGQQQDKSTTINLQAKSIKGNSTDAIHKALLESKEDGFNPTLAIILVTNTENEAALQSEF